MTYSHVIFRQEAQINALQQQYSEPYKVLGRCRWLFFLNNERKQRERFHRSTEGCVQWKSREKAPPMSSSPKLTQTIRPIPINSRKQPEDSSNTHICELVRQPVLFANCFSTVLDNRRWSFSSIILIFMMFYFLWYMQHESSKPRKI